MASARRLAGVATLLAGLAIAGWFASGLIRPGAPADRVDAPARGGELVALLRSEPTTYIRAAEVRGTASGDLLSMLIDAPLVRVDRESDTLEPWLAERWSASSDHLEYTLTLRDGITFSDGSPLTSADVLFSFAVVYDPRVNSGLAADLKIAGQPLDVTAPDARTIVIRFPAPFAPGLRLLDSLPILPRHRLEAAFNEGRLAKTWSPGQDVSQITGLGPFVLVEHAPGQRLVLKRNPRYWRRDDDGTPLPYLETLTVLVVPDQNAEAVRMQAGEADLMSNGDVRPEDVPAYRRLAEQGRIRLIPAGMGLDPNQLWFNLSPKGEGDPRSRWMRHRSFRRAVSCAADRQAIANAVYLGEAVPIHGPVSPANRTWHRPPARPCDNDPAAARELLAALGLSDRDGDGVLEDDRGTPARFSILTQSGNTIRERTVAMLQEQLRRVGLAVDVAGLEQGALGQRWRSGDYDAIYFGVQSSQTDPALASQFWLSSGFFHFWNPSQSAPATEWERRIDELMLRVATESDTSERQRLFADVQQVFYDELPALYFVAPKVTLAVSSRLRNERPVPQIPQLLWNAEALAVTTPR